jgi:hypothetical protein
MKRINFLGFALATISAIAMSQSTTRSLTKKTVTAMAPDGRLLLNGTPTFFIGTNPGPRIDIKTPEGKNGWAELASGGINVVRGMDINDAKPETIQGARAYMDAAASQGVYVCPFLWKIVGQDSPAKLDQLKQVVDALKDHPALFFWKLGDEPEWGKVPVDALHKDYELIKKSDPDHLVWITHAPRGTTESLRRYNAACDVLALDIYPVSDPPGKNSLLPNKGLSMVGDYTRQMMDIAGGKKMLFMVLQVFWSGVNPQHNPSNKKIFPTFQQERYMTYQAIINGADSLAYFGLAGDKTAGGGEGIDKELGLNWTYWRTVLKPLLSEIKPGSQLYPALVAPDAKVGVKFTGAPQIEVRCKQAGDDLYILAAAREGATQKVQFSGVPDGKVMVLFEDRNLNAAGGAFSDSFAEHDVHIYKMHRAATNP